MYQWHMFFAIISFIQAWVFESPKLILEGYVNFIAQKCTKVSKSLKTWIVEMLNYHGETWVLFMLICNIQYTVKSAYNDTLRT